MRVIVDGLSFNVSDAESSQFEIFTLNEYGGCSPTIPLWEVLENEALYDVFIGGQKKYYSLGDFTFDEGGLTSANGSADADLICTILIK